MQGPARRRLWCNATPRTPRQGRDCLGWFTEGRAGGAGAQRPLLAFCFSALGWSEPRREGPGPGPTPWWLRSLCRRRGPQRLPRCW